MQDMTLVNASPEQREESKQLSDEIEVVEEAFCKVYEKWGVFWDKLGYERFRISIPNSKMEQILKPNAAVIKALMRAADRAAEMGVLKYRVKKQETER